MRLADVAKYFDKSQCADAYTPFTAFVGQLSLYDDAARDGVTVQRRILSLAPGTAIPARRTCTLNGETWVIGTHQSDDFSGSVIRTKYVIHRADGVFALQTASQAIAAAGGVTTYGSKLWVKDARDLAVASKLEGFFNIYLPSTEAITEGMILTIAGRAHIARNSFVSAAGFLVAECDELAADARQAATYFVRTYTPATDTEAPAAGISTFAIRLRFENQFAYQSPNVPQMMAGDVRVLIAKSVVATAKVNDTLTLPDGTWQVISVTDQTDAWGIHARRAGT